MLEYIGEALKYKNRKCETYLGCSWGCVHCWFLNIVVFEGT